MFVSRLVLTVWVAAFLLSNPALALTQEFSKSQLGILPSEAKISNGTLALPIELPVIVQLFLAENGTALGCAGSILTPNLILTAAHCMHDIPELNLMAGFSVDVAAGALMWGVTGRTTQKRQVIDFIRHEGHDVKTSQNDIAILVLSKPLELTDAVQPVNLPEPGETFTGVGQIAGWGHESDGRPSLFLMEAKVPLLEDAACPAILANVTYEYDARYMLCAGGNLTDACKGDSGGPLLCTRKESLENPPVVQGDSPKQYLCGIVSWGDGCGTPGVGTAYTRIASYVEWIRAKMQMLDGVTSKSAKCGIQFDCGNGRCIPQHKVCNAYNDCGTGLDEAGCGPCNQTQFRCAPDHGYLVPQKCIPLHYVCDYEDDCKTGLDEMGCGTCPVSQFRCRLGFADSRCSPRECTTLSLIVDDCYDAVCRNRITRCPDGRGRAFTCLRQVAAECSLALLSCPDRTSNVTTTTSTTSLPSPVWIPEPKQEITTTSSTTPRPPPTTTIATTPRDPTPIAVQRGLPTWNFDASDNEGGDTSDTQCTSKGTPTHSASTGPMILSTIALVLSVVSLVTGMCIVKKNRTQSPRSATDNQSGVQTELKNVEIPLLNGR